MQGLQNLGNTCSMNALIQCVGHVSTLREFLLNYDGNIHTSEATKYSITKELKTIFHQMWQLHQSLIPRRFMSALYEKLDYMEMGEQQDICEVWMMLCEEVAKECFDKNHIKQYQVSNDIVNSWVTFNPAYAKLVIKAQDIKKKLNFNSACEWLHLMQGMNIMQVQCTHCNALFHNLEPFTILPLEISNNSHGDPDLIASLHTFLKTEVLKGWTCDKCKCTNNGEKLTRIWDAPPVLCISLKRFAQTTKTVSKNNARVQIPTELKIGKECLLGPDFIKQKDDFLLSYQLQSVACHIGNITGGHYTAIGKVDTDYYHYDDIVVDKIDAKNMDECVSSNGYLFMYERLPL